ncbi:MAG TPA: hypothetical protein VMV49_11085 [Candidatus Deferrimicrobium sp.]|nr:hypothetical protein [Candidatus Deferrimicrobium sp.]
MTFDEEDRVFELDLIVEICQASKEAEQFEKKHPHCSILVDQMPLGATRGWFNNDLGVGLPRNLWVVDFEAFEQEKLSFIVDPLQKKVIDVKSRKIESNWNEEFEELDALYEEGEDIEGGIYSEDEAIPIENKSIDDVAIEIATSSDFGRAFQNKHPDCVWSFENLNDNGKYDWIKILFESEMVKTWGKLPEDLSVLEVEARTGEKGLFIISVSQQKIFLTQFEKLEPEAI